MAGSHRADHRAAHRPRRRVRGWLWAVLAVVVVLVGAWLVVPEVVGGDAHPQAATPTPTEIASKSPTGDPTTAPTTPSPPAPSATPTPTTPADLPTLDPDQPRRLTIAGILDAGFDDAIDATGDTLEPVSESNLSRWAGAARPGSPGEGQVVIVGVARPDPASAFADLGKVVTGTRISLRTDQGLLTYTVARRLEVDDSALLADKELTDDTTGRLVLVAQRYAASGDRLTRDLVVVAVLTAADPA